MTNGVVVGLVGLIGGIGAVAQLGLGRWRESLRKVVLRWVGIGGIGGSYSPNHETLRFGLGPGGLDGRACGSGPDAGDGSGAT